MKPGKLRDRLPELALGTLPDDEARALEVELARSLELRRELDGVVEALAAAAVATLQAGADPAPRGRERLLAALGGPDRFAPFFATLSRVCDLPIEAVKAVLAKVDDAAGWVDGLPGMKLLDFVAGPRISPVDAGLVRLAPGAVFPRHKHLGEETTVVLEGTLLDGGAAHGPGAVVIHGTDSVHDYAAGSDRDLVMIVLQRGIAPVF